MEHLEKLHGKPFAHCSLAHYHNEWRNENRVTAWRQSPIHHWRKVAYPLSFASKLQLTAEVCLHCLSAPAGLAVNQTRTRAHPLRSNSKWKVELHFHHSFAPVKPCGCSTAAVFQKHLIPSLSRERDSLGENTIEYDMCLICQRQEDEDISVGTARCSLLKHIQLQISSLA